ncbi:hypothetical protein TNCV_3803121 [Trichonephila clavipes]|nr:hypothetical protein TNCV_3803121 [Trichonephila clavipes]
MDGDPLLQCTGLNEYPADNIVSQYWEAWRQMVKKPNTGVVYINKNITKRSLRSAKLSGMCKQQISSGSNPVLCSFL